MNNDMKKRIDAVLDRVKDPESGLSVSELGLVTKLRYSEEHSHLYIFTDFSGVIPLSHLFCNCIVSIIINTKSAGIRVSKRVS